MKIYFDGFCAPNPGMAGCGVVIAGSSVEKFRQEIGYGTNNQSEWCSLLWGMEIALGRGFDEVQMIGDSLLVVNQANGIWKVKSDDLKPFKEDFDKLKRKFKKLTIKHVRREHNLAGQFLEFG